MTQAAATQHGLIDIVAPAVPPAAAVPAWAVALLLLLALGVTAYLLLRYFRSPRQQSKRRLAQLRRQWQHRRQAPRSTAHALAGILRHGLRVRRLHTAPPSVQERERWSTFVARLERLQYGPTPSADELTPLLDQAARWLRR